MYGKLFASLYQGTLRGCADEILVFTNLLAHADQYGHVDKHWRSISEECGIPIERVKDAIATLEAPDPESRSPEEDGRRLLPMDEHRAWGWRIVNYEKYRAMRNEEDRREQNRLAQQRWRDRHSKPSVSTDKPDKPKQKQKHIQIQEEEYVCIGGDTKNAEDPKPKATPFPSDFAITDEMRSWAKTKVPNLDIDDELEEFCGYWRDVDNGKTKRTLAGWRQTWQGRMRDVYKRTPRARAQTQTNGKTPPNGNGNGYDPTKDIMSSEYIMPPSRLTFGEAALIYFDGHHDDGTREKYEQMKINWLETVSGKGHEDEIEEYERSYRFRQRFSEAG